MLDRVRSGIDQDGAAGVAPGREPALEEHDETTAPAPQPDREALPTKQYADTGTPSARAPAVAASSAKSSRAFTWMGAGIRLFILVLTGGLVLFVTNEWNRWVGAAVYQTTDDAYLHADLTPLAAKSPGYVRAVPVKDFQRVKAGDLLVEIVDDDYRAQLDQAEADVAAARAAIDNIDQQMVLQEAFIKQA